MKTIKCLWVVAVLFLFFQPTQAQVYKIDQLPYLLAKTKTDSVAKLEYLAAKEFHILLNQYRAKYYRMKQLKWSDTIWLVAYNHTAWMAYHSKLSHQEKSNTKYFTGTHPGDRCAYVSKDMFSINYSGENALYTYIADKSLPLEQQAKTIARDAFQLWRTSRGHQKNMIGNYHTLHGAAFKIKPNGTVWSTSFFARSMEKRLQYSQNENGHLIKKP